MAKATIVAAPTSSEIVRMMFRFGNRAIVATIPDECLTLDCERAASRLMILMMNGEISLSWMCEVCAGVANEGIARLRWSASKNSGVA